MTTPGITIHLPRVGTPLEMTMDEATKVVLGQTAMNFAQAGSRHNADSTQISIDAARMFQLNSQLVGAKAAGQLDRDTLSFNILQARAAQAQPQVDSKAS